MSTFDTPEPITATIDLSIGDVQINTSDRGATVVEVHPTDTSNQEDVKAAQQTRVEYAGGQLLVKAPKMRSWLNRGGPSIDVRIELPAGSHVHGDLGLGDLESQGRLGDCRIKTGLGRIRLDEVGALNLRSGAGAISVDRATGRAEVTTGSGELRLRQLDGSAAIKNSNGATWVGIAGDDVRLRAANGSITVDMAHAGVDAKSANGDVRIGEVMRGSVVLETKMGDLEVGIREGTAAWLDVSSRVGHVRNALEAAEEPATASETETETVQVRGRTSVGDIAIRRRPRPVDARPADEGK